MQTPNDLVSKRWFTYLTVPQQQLLQTSVLLLAQAEAEFNVPDFGYIIFPAAKAYEGVLKKYLLDMELIDERTHADRRFRIGRALNPDVRNSHQDEYWLYDDISQVCGENLARQIWETWLECRNHIFHFFPGQQEITTLPEARIRVEQIMATLDSLVMCYDQNYQHNQEEKNV